MQSIESVQENLAFWQEHDYLVAFNIISCLHSVIFLLNFFLISCEGANYPAAYQLKTMPGAKEHQLFVGVRKS